MLIDEARIKELFSLYYKDIYRYCLVLTKNHFDAEDLAQKTFILLSNKAKRIEDNNLRSWLYTAAFLEFLDMNEQKIRENKRTAFSFDDEKNASTLVVFDDFEAETDKINYPDEILIQYKERIFSLLSDKEKALYNAIYAEHKTNAEIAQELGITEKAVSVRSSRMRKRIYRIIKDLRTEFWR